MLRPLTLIAGITLTAAFAAPVLLSGDYSTLPPTMAQMHTVLTTNPRLTDQIAVAEKATDGIAADAAVDLASGNAHVVVHTADKRFDLVIDSTGTITSQVEVFRFPGEPVEGEWTETASGLKYWDIKVGDGATPPLPSSRLRVHCTGWLIDRTPFYSTHDGQGTPIDIPLNRMIQGWTEGLSSMKEGGKRKLIIPPALGYGTAGYKGRVAVPPNATLVYDVELIKVL